MVLARAGNWEMKNIFYYLTNHLNNFQCSAQISRDPDLKGQSHPALWPLVTFSETCQRRLGGRLCDAPASGKGLKTGNRSMFGAAGSGCCSTGSSHSAQLPVR